MDRQILFILGAHTCVPSDPLQAARDLGCRSLVLTPTQPTCAEDAELMDRVEVIHLSRPDEATELARKYHAKQPINAVVSYDDGASILAARIAAELGLLGHPVAAGRCVVTGPGLLGGEGQRALGDQESDLFPSTIRPAFLRLLWVTLAVLAVVAGVLLAALAGRLP